MNSNPVAAKTDTYRIMCVECRSFLYWYYGDFKGRFDWENFKPSHPGVADPEKKKPMICPDCTNPFYMVNLRGGPIFMTDRGWKPIEPTGVSSMPSKGGEFIAVDDPTKNMDYKEQTK